MPALEATAVAAGDGGDAVRGQPRGARRSTWRRGSGELPGARVVEHLVLDGELGANGASPRVADGAAVSGDTLRAVLPARSWNVLRVAA